MTCVNLSYLWLHFRISESLSMKNNQYYSYTTVFWGSNVAVPGFVKWFGYISRFKINVLVTHTCNKIIKGYSCQLSRAYDEKCIC